MGTNLSQCAGSLTKQEYEIRADVTGISSDNATIDSIRTIRADSYRYESDTANSHHTPEYRMRSDSIESESSIILLNSMNTSELDTGTAVVQLLHYCESGNGASVRLLLSHCDALNEVLNDYHMCHVGDREMNITPLMLAAACGHPHIVHTLLISQNILANAISNDSYGQTALHIAVSLGQLMCVQVLVASMKVDVNSRDNLEMTPLHVATFGHFDEAIRLLLEREDINCGLQDANGNSVLHIGAINGDPSALKSIIQHASMIDFNKICCYGNQPSIRGTSSIQRPSLGGSLQLLVDVRNNDGLNVKTILKQNIATVKSLSLSSQMCTSEYLELCDDAHRCLALYNSATTCLNSKQENCDTIKSGGAARDRDTDGDRAMDQDRDRDRNRNWERDGRTDEHSPHEDITTALSWSPKAVLRKNGSYIKICSPLSH